MCAVCCWLEDVHPVNFDQMLISENYHQILMTYYSSDHIDYLFLSYLYGILAKTLSVPILRLY